MKHYEMSEWVDFTRGLQGPGRRAMEGHLASGCQKCVKTVEFLRGISAFADAEEQLRPPRYAEDSVKAMYVLQQPEKVHVLPSIVARLVYDSFRDPLPAGVRSRSLINRHALYEAGDYNLDLHLEHERGTPAVTLVGQVANWREPGRQLAFVPAFLVDGENNVVGRSATNQFGEFQLQYKPRPHLRLYVPVADQKRIEVQMSHLDDEGPQGEERAKDESNPN